MWLTDVKYLSLSLNTTWTLVFLIDTHVYRISKITDINKEYVCQTRNI